MIQRGGMTEDSPRGNREFTEEIRLNSGENEHRSAQGVRSCAAQWEWEGSAKVSAGKNGVFAPLHFSSEGVRSAKLDTHIEARKGVPLPHVYSALGLCLALAWSLCLSALGLKFYSLKLSWNLQYQPRVGNPVNA